MAMVDLGQHPIRIGYTFDGLPVYRLPADLVVPYPKQPLVPVILQMTPLEALTEMDARKARFEADQAVNLKNSGVWENVGYVDEFDTLGITTAYYQIGFPLKDRFEQEAMDAYRWQGNTPYGHRRPSDPPTPPGHNWGHIDWGQ